LTRYEKGALKKKIKNTKFLNISFNEKEASRVRLKGADGGGVETLGNEEKRSTG